MVPQLDPTIGSSPQLSPELDPMAESRCADVGADAMGAFFNEELSFPPVHANFASSQEQLIRFSKNVHDNVHGNIYLDPVRYVTLNNLVSYLGKKKREAIGVNGGVTHLVYPGAVHSRFEHSLGVYWLAGAAIQKLKQNQGLELGIDNFDIQTVKLAGLLHDVGHGPFSHLFEREFLPRVVSGCKWSHEQMSLKMVDHIVDEHHIDVDFEMIKKVKEMIVASSELTLPKGTREKHFLYDIVANGRNGIDVDKFDYIVRDSRACGLGCNFEFQRSELNFLEALAIELMVVDALLKANDFLEISSSIEDPSDYWKLDDSIIKTIEIAPNQELKESRDLILRIRRRNLYQFCNEYTVPKENLEHFKDVTPQDIVCSQKNGGAILKEEDVAVSNVRIDLARGRHNPLESINFFKDYESKEKFPIPDNRISHLLPACYQDMIVRVYSKKPELVGAISEAFENFQLKTYGIKAQVHETPEKKKRRL
ncbi:HD domain-containing protein [Citrus sinensis]|uniref:HD domain-containing protein n=1 Tax=Citrus sinensis TaxID=2711 RepID=A0ACB8MYF8_CITSI|nr:HD domain-containing protein [Citrus sinensis]